MGRAADAGFGTTIVDLGAFAADEYAAELDSWCRATLIGWGVAPSS